MTRIIDQDQYSLWRAYERVSTDLAMARKEGLDIEADKLAREQMALEKKLAERSPLGNRR